jgi:hypothetical protein
MINYLARNAIFIVALVRGVPVHVCVKEENENEPALERGWGGELSRSNVS